MTSMHTTLIRRASGDYINFCSFKHLGILLHLLIGILVQCRLSLHLTIFPLTICRYLPILSGRERSVIKNLSYEHIHIYFFCVCQVTLWLWHQVKLCQMRNITCCGKQHLRFHSFLYSFKLKFSNFICFNNLSDWPM